jgi:hypothetical protein
MILNTYGNFLVPCTLASTQWIKQFDLALEMTYV